MFASGSVSCQIHIHTKNRSKVETGNKICEKYKL